MTDKLTKAVDEIEGVANAKVIAEAVVAFYLVLHDAGLPHDLVSAAASLFLESLLDQAPVYPDDDDDD